MTNTSTIELEVWSFRVLCLKRSGTAEEIVKSFITYGGKLLSADWLRHRAFFLNHEGTFDNQEGMIT